MRIHSLLEAGTRALAVGGVLIATTLGGASISHADSLLVTCTFTSEITYSPGVTYATNDVQVDVVSELSNCVGDSAASEGTLQAHGHGNVSCLAGQVSLNGRIDWDNGTQSVFTRVVNRSLRPDGSAVTVGVGSVTSGRYTGYEMAYSSLITNQEPLSCLTSTGQTAATSTGLLTLSSL